MAKTRNKNNAIEPPSLVEGLLKQLLVQRVGLFLLMLLTLVSAFSLVLLSHENRQLLAELEQQNKGRDELDIEYRKLTTEQRTLGEQTRIEAVAKENLGMKTLELKSERIIKRVEDSD